MGKKQQEKTENTSDSSASDGSVDDVSVHGRSITKVPLKKTCSVAAGLGLDDESAPADTSDTLLPTGTQSMEFVVTKPDTDDIFAEQHAMTVKKNKTKRKSSTVTGRLESQDPIAVMTVQQDLIPSFNIYDNSRKDEDGKISPVCDRKPSLCGDENMSSEICDPDILTPPPASRSGSGDFGAITPPGSLSDDQKEDASKYEDIEGQAPANSEGNLNEHDEDWDGDVHDRSGTDMAHDREDKDEKKKENEEGGEASKRSSISKEGDVGFVLQFSLAKVLAHKAATHIRRIRAKKAAKHQERLGLPNLALLPELDQSTSDADLEVRVEHKGVDQIKEGKSTKKSRWPKVLVSLWPMGMGKGKRADFIPLDMCQEVISDTIEDDQENNEVASNSDGLQKKESHSSSVSGEDVDESAENRNRKDSRHGRKVTNKQETVTDDRRRSSCDRHLSVITEHGITRYDSKEADETQSRKGSEAVTFMNLVRDFMEDGLIRSYQQSHVHGLDQTAIMAQLEDNRQLRENQAKARAIAAIKGTVVQCDDMLLNMTDEEMVARIVIKHIIKNAVDLVVELEYQETIDAAAKAIADEILSQIDESVGSVTKAEHRFSICIEVPKMEAVTPESKLKLHVEYPSDTESDGESGTAGKSQVAQRKHLQSVPRSESQVRVTDEAEDQTFRMFKPLPPIGSGKDTEDVGLIDPATTSDNKVISTMAGRQKVRGQVTDPTRKPVSDSNNREERQSLSDGICQRESRSLECYDGVTRVMASLATQTDISWLTESGVERPHKPNKEVTCRHTHRLEASHKHERDSKGVSHSPSVASVRSTRSTRPTPPAAMAVTDRKIVPSSSRLRDQDKIPNLHIAESSEEDGEEGKTPRKAVHPLVTEVGPPHIIKYKKESESPLQVEVVEHTDNAFIRYNDRFSWIQGGIFHGQCEFCQQHILPYPTDVERQQATDPSKLFCCQDYEKFVQTLITNTDNISEEAVRRIFEGIDKLGPSKSPELIDIRSQQQKFSGNKEAMKAKIRAAERMRERELLRQQKAIERGPLVEGQRMGANFHRGQSKSSPQGPSQSNKAIPKTVATMSFSLSIALSSTSAKVLMPGTSYPTAPPGLYVEKDRRRSRRLSGDEYPNAEYQRRPSGRAKERVRSQRQSGIDPHFSDLRRMLEGHSVETYKSPKESIESDQRSRRRRESRRMRQMRKSRELSQPKNSPQVSVVQHADQLHPGELRRLRHDNQGDTSNRRHSTRRRSTMRHHSKDRLHSPDRHDSEERRHSTDKGHSTDSRHTMEKNPHGASRQGDKRQRSHHGDQVDSDSTTDSTPRSRRTVQHPPRHVFNRFMRNLNAPPWPSSDTEHFEMREGRLQPKVADFTELIDLEPEPVLPPWAVSEVCDGQMLDIDALRQMKMLITKYYPHGKLFVILFPDGTGSVFYPSGKLAITISSVTFGFYTYVVQDKRGNIMAVFAGQGHAYTNYQNTKLRLCLDQKGGLELDWRGGQKRKWQWRGQEEHVHAPPLQPITFAITKHAAVRLMAQENITLTFNCWARACRFQVGAKLRVPKHFVAHKEALDEVALMRNETKTKIEAILDRIANLLKFPHCTKVDKLALPLFIRATIERQEHMRAVMQATVKGLDIQSSIFVN